MPLSGKFSKLFACTVSALKIAAGPRSFVTILWYGRIKPSLVYRGLCTADPFREFKLHVRLGTGHSHPLTLRDNQLDIATLLEIFGGDHLNPLSRCTIIPRVIYDLGANIGISTAYFCLALPDATVYSFEPEEGNFQIASKNLGSFPNAVLSRQAIAAHSGMMEFTCGVDTRGGKLSSKKDSISGSAQQVEVTTLTELIEKAGLPTPDFLKVDVEGSEIDVLSGAGAHLKHVKVLNVETHSTELHMQCLDILGKEGFRIVFEHCGMGWIWAVNEVGADANQA
jgi:FkbM family methyltransferase